MVSFRARPRGVQGIPLRVLRLALLAAAIVAVVAVATGATLWHYDAPGGAATCPICHAAHLPSLQPTPAGGLASPTAVAWLVPQVTESRHVSLAALQTPPRAPPANA